MILVPGAIGSAILAGASPTYGFSALITAVICEDQVLVGVAKLEALQKDN